MKRTITKKKVQKLGEGYIWFSNHGGVGSGFTHVGLTKNAHGRGFFVPIKIGKLGGWQKVKLYVEFIPKKR